MDHDTLQNPRLVNSLGHHVEEDNCEEAGVAISRRRLGICSWGEKPALGESSKLVMREERIVDINFSLNIPPYLSSCEGHPIYGSVKDTCLW